MKRWVIVEDRPWVMTRFIQEIWEKAQAEGQEYLAPDILYYIAGEDEEKRKVTENNFKNNVNEFEDTTGIQVHKFNTLNFEEQMEKYYNDGYTIFMDLNLTGVNAQYFNERNNVQYAREKQQDCREKNKKEEQIWLYTTGASLDASFLYSEFPDNVVEVTNFEDGKAYLDLDTSWELLKDEV